MGACCWCEWAYIQEEPDSQALNITFLKKTHLNVIVFEKFVMREYVSICYLTKKTGLSLRFDLL